jgi:hypothetical protein
MGLLLRERGSLEGAGVGVYGGGVDVGMRERKLWSITDILVFVKA